LSKEGVEIVGAVDINPCVHGDHGTIAITPNMIPRVISAEPDFKTKVDLPVSHATPKHVRKYKK
jgi:hypothetical protein